MQTQTTDTSPKRLRILGDDEIEALYGRPRFTDDERREYFSLSATEKAILGVNRTKVRKVSQDFSIIIYINMLGDWQLFVFVAFPSTFGGHIFFATHCQI